MMTPYRILVEILLGMLSLSLITFGVAYYFRSNWRATKVGRYVLYFMITLAVTFTYMFLNIFIEEYPGRYIVNLSLAVALNIVSWRLVWVLFKIQRRNGEEVKQRDGSDVPRYKSRTRR